MTTARSILYRVGAVRDAAHIAARPGAVAVHDGRIVAAGEVTQVVREAGRMDEVIDLPRMLIVPGMVNAHAHLDLSTLPREPYAGDFIDWLRGIIQSRATATGSVTDAVHHGLRLSRDAGVRLIADIAGSPEAVRARVLASPAMHTAGASFLEVTGFGQRGLAAVDAAHQALNDIEQEMNAQAISHRPHAHQPIYLGCQPHAPYSTGKEVRQRIASLYAHRTTHLAETLAECQFVREGTGPFARLLHDLGRWDDAIHGPQHAEGTSPVQAMKEELRQRRGAGAGSARDWAASAAAWLLAHCNYVDDADIALLADTGTSVAYCPVASDYFGHRNHRYRDMLAAGVNVCLGTDSIVCQPPDEPQPLSILAQMRHIHRRDGTDPQLLLAMATIHGARAVPGHHRAATLAPGEPADFVMVRFDAENGADPLMQVMHSSEPVTMLTTAMRE